jgi:hypothetical protein
MRRVVLFGLVLAVAAALVVGLHPVGPARTFDDYEHKAKDTAESVVSSLGTARLAASLAPRGRLYGPYVSVLLSEADEAVAHARQTFEGVQPPDHHSDVLRRRLGRLLDRASTHVQSLRIAARRGELSSLDRRARPLPALIERLDRFVDRHE